MQERERTSSCGISATQTCCSTACAERKVHSDACQAAAEPLRPLIAIGPACLLRCVQRLPLPVVICVCSKAAALAQGRWWASLRRHFMP